MTSESKSHDKGFWIQITLGIAVVILIFMYIRSVADKPSEQVSSSSTSQELVVSSDAQTNQVNTPTQVAATNDAATVATDEVPVAAVAEPAASKDPVTSEPELSAAPEDTLAAETKQEEVPKATDAAQPVEASISQSAKTDESAEITAPAEEESAQTKEGSSVEVAKTEAGEQALQKKAVDWLSKLGFGGESKNTADQAVKAEEMASETTQMDASSVEAAQATEATVAAPVDARDLNAASQPSLGGYTQAPNMTPNGYPQVGRQMQPQTRPDINEAPTWAKERIQRVDELRKELRSAMQEMRSESMRRLEEERRQREEQIKRDMPEWMREHMGKVEQLREELHKEMDALQKEARKHHNEMQPTLPTVPAPQTRAPYYGPQGGYAPQGGYLPQGSQGREFYPEPSYPAYPYMGR